MAVVSRAPCRQPLRPPLPALSGVSHTLPCTVHSRMPKEPTTMAETTARRRVRHLSRTTESDRKNAAAALQRALDRRDNGGETGH